MLWPFEYIAPTTRQEVTQALLEDENHQVMAGGTDLLVHMRSGRLRPKKVIDLKRLEELHVLEMTPGKQSFIGAGVTLNQLIENSAYPWSAVRDAAASIATYQVRNRATVVGNLCHASPAADMAPPMLVLDGVMRVINRDGNEIAMPLIDFFSGPQENVLKKGQWVQGIEIPVQPEDVQTIFLKKMRYRGHDCSGVNLAAYYSPDAKRLRLAIGACAPTPVLFSFDHLLQEKKSPGRTADTISESILKKIQPISDNRASAAYRLEMASLFVKRAVSELLN